MPPESVDECIPKCEAAFKNSGVFYHLQNRKIYEEILAMGEQQVGIDMVTLIQHLRDGGELEPAGGLSYVASLPECTPSPGNLSYYLDIVLEKYRLRQLADIGMRVVSKAHEAHALGALDSLALSEAKHLADELMSGGGLGAELDARRFDAQRPPAPLRAVYKLRETMIFTPGNLTSITAAIKSGKSAFVGALLTSTFASESQDTLGLRSANLDRRAVIHFDTEQSREDHWELVDRARRRAGSPTVPSWVCSYSLAGMSAHESRRFVWAAVRRDAQACGGVHSIIIDGVADLVCDVNDPVESNGLVASLHALAIEHDCPIITVIHLNPGRDKTRGHLGSQLERKCETNLMLEKVDEVTTVWSLKQRRAPIPKGTGPSFRWDSAQGMHISCEGAKVATARNELDHIFASRSSIPYGELVAALKTELGVSTSTAKRRVATWSQLSIIEKTSGNHYARKD